MNKIKKINLIEKHNLKLKEKNLKKINEIKSTYTFFENKSLDNNYRDDIINSELKNAVKNNEFDIFYQPQINSINGEIVGMEALLRWNNEKLGSVSPAEFIPIAEKNGHIVRIGDWVIEAALKQAAIWENKGYKFNNISINVSPIQIMEKGFKDNILNLHDKYSIHNNLLEIEITEGTLVEACNDKIDLLNELTKNGISIAIDDFGTGYSSLSYLINFPITTLKIDKIFVNKIENYKNKAIVKNIINLAKDLKYKIITEGVETKHQIKVLTDLGCNIIQGFYFSKPVSKYRMEELLKEGKIIL